MENNFIPQVCALLGTVPGVMLDEEVIALPIYKEAAWRDICAVLENPEQVQLDEARAPLLEQAWVYATAIRVLPYYKQQVMKVEQTTAAKTERFEPDWDGLLGTLQGGLDEALGELVPGYEAGGGFIGFRLTFSSPKGGG